MSTTPPARPSWLPPARPGTAGSSDSWNSAIIDDKSNRGIFHPDQKMIPEFAKDFDVVPRLSNAEAQKRLKCNAFNMNYIPSTLPMPHVLPMQTFYDDMAKRQWNRARPSAAAGMAPAFLRIGQGIGMRRDMGMNQVADASRPAIPRGVATDWKAIPELQRVNAYGFRGDKREPRTIKASNGFFPPSTRTDAAYTKVIAKRFALYMKQRFNQDVDEAEIISYINGKGQAGRVFTEYEVWRMILKGEEMHLGRMLSDEFLKGYISTSRDVEVARNFASGITSADKVGSTRRGVYAMHVPGAILLPKIYTHVHATQGEAELAYPGPLTWDKCVAFRLFLQTDAKFEDHRTFTANDGHRAKQVIFVRKGFQESDPTGFKEVVLSLSYFD